MSYDAKAIANYFLDKAAEENVQLTPMKLQKLVYFAHGWYLGLYHEPLINDPIEAWQFGPVIPSIYQEFKSAGSRAITSRATEIDWGDMEWKVAELPDSSQDQSSQRARALMDQIWTIYGPMSAINLSNLTHLDGTPWSTTRLANGNARNAPIDDGQIEKYFAQQLENNRRHNEADAAR